jgi:multiple sugar transport system permease protein
MVLYLYRKGFEQFRFGYASAIAWVLFVVVVVFSFFALRSSRYWVFYGE